MKNRKLQPFTEQGFSEILNAILKTPHKTLECRYCHKMYDQAEQGGSDFCSPGCGGLWASDKEREQGLRHRKKKRESAD